MAKTSNTSRKTILPAPPSAGKQWLEEQIEKLKKQKQEQVDVQHSCNLRIEAELKEIEECNAKIGEMTNLHQQAGEKLGSLVNLISELEVLKNTI